MAKQEVVHPNMRFLLKFAYCRHCGADDDWNFSAFQRTPDLLQNRAISPQNPPVLTAAHGTFLIAPTRQRQTGAVQGMAKAEPAKFSFGIIGGLLAGVIFDNIALGLLIGIVAGVGLANFGAKESGADEEVE